MNSRFRPALGLLWLLLALCPMPPHALATPPASRPARVHLTLDAQGKVSHQRRTLSLAKLVQFLEGHKATKTPITLSIHPRAPYKAVLITTSLLKESRLPWTQRILSTNAQPPAARTPSTSPKTAPAPPKAAPAPPKAAPSSRPAAPMARPTAPKVRPAAPGTPKAAPQGPAPWTALPLHTMPAPHKGKAYELRAQMKVPKGSSPQPLPTALVLQRNGKLTPLKRAKTDTFGRFRYKFFAQPKDRFLIAVLHGKQFLRYPVPLQQARQGLLYLRVVLPPARAASSHPPLSRMPASHPPISRPPTRAPVTRAPASSSQPPAKAGAWGKLHLATKALRGPKLQLRLQLLNKNGTPAADLATGLIQRQGKKRLPLGRGKSNATGKIRYLVSHKQGATYELAVLHGTKLHLQPLPPITQTSGTRTIQLRLTTASPQALSFEGIYVLVERMPKQENTLRVTQFVSLLYQPTPGKPRPTITLPIPANTVQVQISPQLKKMKIKRTPAGIQLGTPLKAGRSRFSYAYTLKVQKGLGHVHFSLPHPTEQITLYVQPSLKIQSKSKQKPRRVTLSQRQGKKRPFMMLRFGSKAKGQSFFAHIRDPQARDYKGFAGWISKMQRNPNRRKKLLGLGVLFTTTVFGFFLLLAAPRKRFSITDDTDDTDDTDNTKTDQTDEKAEATDDTTAKKKDTDKSPKKKTQDTTDKDTDDKPGDTEDTDDTDDTDDTKEAKSDESNEDKSAKKKTQPAKKKKQDKAEDVKEEEDGVIGEEKARFLIDKIQEDGKIDDTEMELLLTLAERGRRLHPSFRAFVLGAVKEAILADKKIDADEVEQLRKLLDHDAEDIEESHFEMTFLFDLNTAVSDQDNDPSWRSFFVEKLSSHLLRSRQAEDEEG